MEVGQIVAELDAEIARLHEVRKLLAGHTDNGHAAKKITKVREKPHTMSAESRARIAAAQKLRWAKQKKAAAK